MLDSLRKASQTLVAKLLLMLLVVSFGVWGVASSLKSSHTDAVITVGDQTVTAKEFQLAYQRQISDISRQFGMRVSAEQARAFGIDQQIFAQLAAGAALDQLAIARWQAGDWWGSRGPSKEAKGLRKQHGR